jgi:hypothetical protein
VFVIFEISVVYEYDEVWFGNVNLVRNVLVKVYSECDGISNVIDGCNKYRWCHL